MKKIYFSGKNKKLYCCVDDEDYENLIKHRWYLNHKGYAQRNRKYVKKIKDCGQILMHRMVLAPKKGFETDHIDFNKLNNVRKNLRHLTGKNNIIRRGSRRKYTGVYLRRIKSGNRYQTYISLNSKKIFVGYFKNEKDAAIAYNIANKKCHGEYAYQNTI